MRPLLSICIPTWNRCVELGQLLDNIAQQSVFCNSNLVELVISDNCSDDQTADVVAEYKSKFGDKIKLSVDVYEREKKKLLFQRIIPLFFDFFHQYNKVPQIRYWYYTCEYHKNYYYASFVYIAFYYFFSNVIPLHQWLGACKRWIMNKRAYRAESEI